MIDLERTPRSRGLGGQEVLRPSNSDASRRCSEDRAPDTPAQLDSALVALQYRSGTRELRMGRVRRDLRLQRHGCMATTSNIPDCGLQPRTLTTSKASQVHCGFQAGDSQPSP